MSHLLKDASTGGQHGTVFLNAPLGGQRDVLQGKIHNGVHLGRDKQSTSLSFPEHPLMELWKMPGLTPLDRRGGPEDGGKGSKATEQAEKKLFRHHSLPYWLREPRTKGCVESLHFHLHLVTLKILSVDLLCAGHHAKC